MKGPTNHHSFRRSTLHCMLWTDIFSNGWSLSDTVIRKNTIETIYLPAWVSLIVTMHQMAQIHTGTEGWWVPYLTDNGCFIAFRSEVLYTLYYRTGVILRKMCALQVFQLSSKYIIFFTMVLLSPTKRCNALIARFIGSHH